MKYLLLDKAVSQGFKLEGYDLSQFNEKVNELASFNKLCTLVPIVYISEYEGKIHFKHIEVLIKYKSTLLKPYKRYNEKTYQFHLVNSIFVQSFRHDLVEPSKVGAPTDKKMLAWLEYLQQIEALKTEILAQRNKKETEFFNKIKDSGLTVSYQSNNGKRGYIETKNFDFYFEVDSDGGINQKITLRCGNTIDDFLNLISGEKN